jgi:hypothetical protein
MREAIYLTQESHSMEVLTVLRSSGNIVEGHYGQRGVGYLLDPDFQASYLERGTNRFVDFLDEVPSASQINKGTPIYGALLSACQRGDRT